MKTIWKIYSAALLITKVMHPNSVMKYHFLPGKNLKELHWILLKAKGNSRNRLKEIHWTCIQDLGSKISTVMVLFKKK